MEAVPPLEAESVFHTSGICKCIFVKSMQTDQVERVSNLESVSVDLKPDLTLK